jgi:hypothetical protein
MDYGLYEDWSLFNGDLLAGFPLLANEEPLTALPEQDGLVSILKTFTFEAPTAPAVFVSKPTAKVVLGHPQQGSADLGLADLLASSPTKDLSNPLESAWMDTKMDLLDLLTYDQDATHPAISAAPAQATMSRPTQLQLSMPSNPLWGVEAAVVPSTSVPTTPEPSMEDNSLQGSIDLLQKLLSASVKMDTLYLNSASTMMQSEVYLPEQDLPFSSPTDQVGEGEDIFMELCATGLEDLLSASLDASIEEGPILSPVSADDVESLLSSNPPSPGNGLTSFIDILDANQPQQADSAYSSLNVSAASMVSETDADSMDSFDSFMDPSPGPEPTAKISPRSAPYAKAGGRGGRKPERKERKKQQNRSAALKYRQKKKEEKGTVTGEVEQLEERNKELKDKVDSISREINYLKDLMAEVYKAKGLVPKKQISKIIRKN